MCSGNMFPHCKDKDGKPLFIIKVKSSVKGAYKADEVHKVLSMLNSKIKNIVSNWALFYGLVYWFDRLEKQQKGDKISIFFEMTGAG